MKLLIAVVERAAPRRPFSEAILGRWSANIGLFATNFLLLGGGLSLAAAIGAEQRGIGLLNSGLLKSFPVPLGVEIAAGFVALDFLLWAQHWAQHRSLFLWRFHRVHHTDLDLDLTSSVRIHPVDALYQVILRMSLVTALGLPPGGVLLYEVLVDLHATLAHASLRVPASADAILRKLIVTPDFHRVHHSAVRKEANGNLGSIFSFWDRLFGTCNEQPEKGHLDMELGVAGLRDPGQLNPLQLLVLPFRSMKEGP